MATDGTVYVGSTDTAMYALNSDGSLKWTFPTRAGIVSSAALDVDGSVYSGSKDKKF